MKLKNLSHVHTSVRAPGKERQEMMVGKRHIWSLDFRGGTVSHDDKAQE